MIRVENADCRSKIIASRAVPEATNATHSRQSPHSVRISSARRPPGCRERSTPPRRWFRGSALRLPLSWVQCLRSSAPPSVSPPSFAPISTPTEAAPLDRLDFRPAPRTGRFFPRPTRKVSEGLRGLTPAVPTERRSRRRARRSNANGRLGCRGEPPTHTQSRAGAAPGCKVR